MCFEYELRYTRAYWDNSDKKTNWERIVGQHIHGWVFWLLDRRHFRLYLSLSIVLITDCDWRRWRRQIYHLNEFYDGHREWAYVSCVDSFYCDILSSSLGNNNTIFYSLDCSRRCMFVTRYNIIFVFLSSWSIMTICKHVETSGRLPVGIVPVCKR